MSVRAGSHLTGPSQARFHVWAPKPKKLELYLPESGRAVLIQRDNRGYADFRVDGVRPGMRYAYRVDGERIRPDPAASVLPDGVHGPAMLLDPAFPWTDAAFRPPPLRDWSVYELHVGTFSPTGDFAGVIRQLPMLRELGVRAIELMPVAPFSGTRNWGYDGVNLYAVHQPYGGPFELKRLVDAAHRLEMAVVLDVVFNHLGPEGCWYGEYMPFWTDRHQTPWGAAINYDGPESEGVRRFVIDSALRWFEEFHVDALRLDAVHGIIDDTKPHVLSQLATEVDALKARTGRPALLIAESDLNESKVLRARPEGWGLDAQWSDDFHHALHARLTDERHSYYADFGSTAQVASALERGYLFEGQPSKFRGRPFGDSSAGLAPERFVVCSQNHDQVGNRARGERLAHLVGTSRARLAAAATLLAPHVPLLFMGEEWAEDSPFLYFTSHADPNLARAVTEGRAREFPELEAQDVPDPQHETTFARSRIHPELRHEAAHAQMYALYCELLELRASHPSLGCVTPKVTVDNEVVRVLRTAAGEKSLVLLAFDSQPRMCHPGAGFHLALDTDETRFGGRGTTSMLLPWSAQVYIGRG